MFKRVSRASLIAAAATLSAVAVQCDSEAPDTAEQPASSPFSGRVDVGDGKISAPFSLSEVMRQVHFAFREEDGKIKGGHTTYGVEVQAGVVRFTPVLPADSGLSSDGQEVVGAALTLETIAVSRGALVLSAGTPRVVIGEKGDLTLSRGGVEERLQNGDDGLEQSWTFDRRPGGSGNLRIRIRADGLRFGTASEHGLHFEDPETGLGVRYGLAQWVDASGARTQVRPVIQNGEIWLEVPASVVDGADYPAVLDPTAVGEVGLNTPIPAAAIDTQTSPSIGWNGTNYLVAWEDYRSGSTWDIYATRVTPAGGILDPAGIVVSSAAKNQRAPEVTAAGGDFFVVWEDYRDNVSYDVFGARINSAGTNLNAGGIPIATGAGDQRAPDVATSGAEYLVVWQDSVTTKIHSARVSSGGTLVDTNPVTVSAWPDPQNGMRTNPVVAYGASKYMVAWEDTRVSASTDIYYARLNINAGALVLLDLTPAMLTNAAGLQTEPTITNGAGYFFAAWKSTEVGSAGDIYGGRLWAVGGRVDGNGFPVSWVDTAAKTAPAVAFDGVNYLLAWADSRTVGGYGDIYSVRVRPSDGYVPPDVPVASGFWVQARPAVCGGATKSLVAWTQSSDVRSALVSTSGVVDPNFLVSKAVGRQVAPAMAYSPTSDRFLVVWQDNRAQTGWDIYGVTVNSLGQVLSNPAIAISTSSGNQTEPRVAFGGTEFLVVWTDDANGAAKDVWGRNLTTNGNLGMAGENRITFGTGDQEHPDVAYDGVDYLVVWQDTSTVGTLDDVDGIMLGHGSWPTAQTPVIAVSTLASDQTYPRVAGCSDCASDSRFLVVYSDARSDGDVAFARVKSNQGVWNEQTIQAPTGAQRLPVVASNGSSFFVAWEHYNSVAGMLWDVYGATVPETGAAGDLVPLSVTSWSQQGVEIAWVGSYYQLAWESWVAGASNIWGAGVRPDSTLVGTASILSAEASSEAGVTLAAGPAGKALLSYYHLDADLGTDRTWARLLTWLPQGSLECADDDDCGTGYCTDGVCCSEACTAGCGVCLEALGASDDGFCTPMPDATVCRASAGSCDIPEMCDGVATSCSADRKASSLTVCRPKVGECDIEETCNGTDLCPPDAYDNGGCYSYAGGCGGWSECVAGSGLCPVPTEILDCVPTTPAPGTAPGDVAGLATSVGDSTSFLYTGIDPIQTGVTVALDRWRASVVRGTVLVPGGEPLVGVTVRVLPRGEELTSKYGQTITRAEGEYDLAIEGGEAVTLEFSLHGYLTAHRKATPGWQEYERLDDVVLIRKAESSTPITFPVQVAGGSLAHSAWTGDSDGERRASVYFKQGTSATGLPGGVPASLRITEFTVGADGPAAMPAELPPTSAYTYAAEFSFDEATTEGVDFTLGGQPGGAVVYVSNFLGLPVGSVVPSGSYDRTTARWVPEENGRVVSVVSVLPSGVAMVDLDDDGVGETDPVLTAAGILDAERRQLALMSDAAHTWPQELWRVPVEHFTVYDFNLGFRPPPGWEEPPTIEPTTDDPVECPDCKEGSIIEVQNQVLGESFPVTGTPFTLEYRSDRVKGRTAGRRVYVPLIPGAVPNGLRKVHVEVVAAGRLVSVQDYSGAQLTTGLAYETTEDLWDGNDPYVRSMHGSLPLRVRVAYEYPAVYNDPVVQQAFMQSGGESGSVAAREGYRFWRNWWVHGESWDQRGIGLGGLSLSAHHVYDPAGGVLLQGDGTRRSVSALPTAASRFVGNLSDENNNLPPEGQCASVEPNSLLGNVDAVAAAPDGGFYFTRRCSNSTTYVTRAQVDRGSGAVTLTPMTSFPGMTTPLTGIAAGPDGRVYVAAPGDHRIYRLTYAGPGLEWTREPFAGNGFPTPPDLEELDQVASRTERYLAAPRAVAVGPDGQVYVTDTDHHRIVVIGADDMLRPFAGREGAASWASDRDEACPGGADGTYQTQNALGASESLAAEFDRPVALAVEPDGDVLVAHGAESACIRRVRRDGQVELVAGTGGPPPIPPAYEHLRGLGDNGDGGAAVLAQLGRAQGLAVDRDGTIYYLSGPDWGGVDATTLHGIRAISPTGIIRRVAGAVTEGGALPQDGVAALGDVLDMPGGLALSPSGDLLVAEQRKGRVIRISGAFPRYPNGNISIPSADGGEVFEFTAKGQHLRTLDGLTGQELLAFDYTAGTGLAGITLTHRGGADTTSVEITGADPVLITAPHARVTSLDLDADGYVTEIQNPALETFQLGYTPSPWYPEGGGLLTSLTDSLSHTSTFTYDNQLKGLLIKDTDARGGYKVLTRGPAGSRQVTVMTKLGEAQNPDGRIWTYDVTATPEGGLVQSAQSPAGSTTTTTWAPDGVITSASPDGLTVITRRTGDPRFGMSAPRRTVEVRRGAAPGATFAEELEFSDLVDPFNYTSVEARLVVTPTEPGELARTHVAVYDRDSKTLVETSAQGRTRTTLFNAVGQPLTVTVPGYADLEYVYDSEGRLQTQTLRQGANTRLTSAVYSPTTGFLQDVTDPAARTVRLDTDAIGRVTFIRELAFAPERVTGLGWDAVGNLTSVTPPGQPSHGFAYSATDLLTSYTAPGAVQTTYAYNDDDQLDLITPPDGAAINPDYDLMKSRLLTLTSGRTVTPGYEPITGRLTSLNVGGGVGLAYGYDGPLLSSTTWAGPVVGTVSRTYDSLFRVATHTAAGGTLKLTYDLDDLPLGVELLPATPLLAQTRDPSNGRLTATDSAVVDTTQTYTAWGEPDDTLATGPSGTLFRENLDYHPDGRIQQKLEEINGSSTTTTYLYDAGGRLEYVTVVGGSVTQYLYDPNGNRTDIKVDGVSQRTKALCGGANPPVVVDSQDRMTRDCDRTYLYRQSGHLTTRMDPSVGTTTVDYDSLGNLLYATVPSGAEIEYDIDGQNRRVGRRERADGKSPWVGKTWLYDDQLRVVVENDSGTGTTSRFIYVGEAHSPDLMIRAGVIYRILKDHLGSPRIVANTATGAVQQRMSFDAWGVATEDWSNGAFVKIPFGFAGGLWDRSTGFIRFGARDYDPVLGRWTAKDPVRFGGGDTNLYAYVGNDPVNSLDPSGLVRTIIKVVVKIGGMGLKKVGIMSLSDAKQFLKRKNGNIMGSKTAAKKFAKEKGKNLNKDKKLICETHKDKAGNVGTPHMHQADRRGGHWFLDEILLPIVDLNGDGGVDLFEAADSISPLPLPNIDIGVEFVSTPSSA